MKKHKCECPETSNATNKSLYSKEEYLGMIHKPGKCKGTYHMKQYKREDKKLWLCSCCNLSGDKEI